MKLRFTFTFIIAAGFYFIFFTAINLQKNNFNSGLLDEKQIGELRKLKNHSNNPFLSKIISEKILKLKGSEENELNADEPNEFMRIINEMKIPYGETKSGYPDNYKIVELNEGKK